nr:MAG TPA: MCSS domain [Caudoviricetes sp.]DAW56817.1 MAG TPA: MCSS domain [Caudoviricetes sp.]
MGCMICFHHTKIYYITKTLMVCLILKTNS